MNKYLILKGCAGLGNRLITLSNAIEYCKNNNRVLFVDWSDGLYGTKGENVFYKYFDLEGVEYITSIERLSFDNLTIYPRGWEKEDIHEALYDNYTYAKPKVSNNLKYKILPRNGKTRNILGYFHYQGRSTEHIINKSNISFVKSLFSIRDICFGGNLKPDMQEDIVIFADYVPTYYPDNLTKHLILKKEINEKVDEFVLEHKLLRNSIGIHVRATDRKCDDAIELIMNKITPIINQLSREDYKIFLATDNAVIESYFSERQLPLIKLSKFIPKVDGGDFGGGIHHWSQKNNRPDLAEIILQESIMDMWLLSKCEYLLYMGDSSFSLIAVTLHNNKAMNWKNK